MWLVSFDCNTIPVAALVTSWIVSPKKPNPIKQSTYECGMETVGENWVQFKAQYYIFALVFLVFDVETVFLFPWAVSLGKLSLFAVLEGMVFILILIADSSMPGVKGFGVGLNSLVI